MALDEDRVSELAVEVFKHLNGTMITAMTVIGDELGLYRALASSGVVTSEILASELSMSERWVREWLHGQAAVGYVDHLGDGRFEMSAEAAAVLADDSHPRFSAGGAGMIVPLLSRSVPAMKRVFESGRGLTYDEFGGAQFAEAQERMWAPWFQHQLVDTVLPALDGVVDKLKHGGRLADTGCGAGVAVMEMARAYPDAEFVGYDNSEHALERANRSKRQTNLENVHFLNPDVDPLPSEPTYDVITTFDCIHDMAHPTPAIRAIRSALKGDGTWFVADVHAGDSLDENLEEANPLLPMLYGFSVLCCLSSSMSSPDAEGFGTLGFGEAKARRMAAEAEFSRFRRHDFANPLNAYYEIRP